MRDDGTVTNAPAALRLLPGRLAVVVVRGRSMEPTLRDGDRLLVRAAARARRRVRDGRLVVVRLPGGRPAGVKRLVHREPEGWWVERDNPGEGVDSWQVGAIAREDQLGVVALRLWPYPRRLGSCDRAAGGPDAPG
jgi:nickel-type superoxide dismutase maturation protease